jgi:hypothetical protein
MEKGKFYVGFNGFWGAGLCGMNWGVFKGS